MAGYTTYSSSWLSDGVPRYVYEERKQKETQQYLIQRGIRSKLLFSCLCFLVACLVVVCRGFKMYWMTTFNGMIFFIP